MVSRTDIHTYELGPTFKVDESFTMRNVMNIIDKLKAVMPHHTPEIEPISEGGIRMEKNYKTIRLGINNWPTIINGEVDPETTLTCDKNIMRTYLKAFREASSWTEDELEHIKSIFEEEGLIPVTEEDSFEYFESVPPPEKCDFGDYQIDPIYRAELYKNFPDYTGEEIVGSYLGHNPYFPSQREWLI